MPELKILHKIWKRFCVFFWISIFLCTPSVMNPDARELEEYAVKAAFVFNFTRFIQWPQESSPETTDTFKVCYTGDGPVKKHFSTLNGKVSGTKKISISHLKETDDSLNCDIIFFSKNIDTSILEEIMGRIKGRPILTIGEHKDFIKAGGIINFLKKNEKLHFSINAQKAKTQHLKISSRLLKLAVIVDGTNERE